MANQEIASKLSFIPWLRRGLSRQINSEQVDTLGKLDENGPSKKRAYLSVATTFDLSPINGSDSVKRIESMQISLVGPGDIGGLQTVSILQVVPADGIKNFESNYFPFIEFFEEDLPWRYTPAKEKGHKLRPWLNILVCKKDEFALQTDNDGNIMIRLKIRDNAHFKEVLGDPSETWRNAHVQFIDQKLSGISNLNSEVNSLLDSNEDQAISRLLSSRVLEENTAYQAFLIPTFETGRLSGLGLSFDEIPAQMSAWGNTLDDQKQGHLQPLDFPVYYQWEFETANGDFMELARKLKAVTTNNLPAALKVDVSKMGNGLNYSTMQIVPKRKVIDVPAATHPIGYASTAFPNLADEAIIRERIKNLLDRNPVLLENQQLKEESSGSARMRSTQAISKAPIKEVPLKDDFRKILNTELLRSSELGITKADNIPKEANLAVRALKSKKASRNPVPTNRSNLSEAIMDDPWIVPPLYGAKQILATSLEVSENKGHQWFLELNLDVRYRAAAGLGKRVVQTHQEDFVHRAWEQVELINELNQKLREQMLQRKTNNALFYKRFANFKDLSLKELKTASSGTSSNKTKMEKKLLKGMMNSFYPLKYATPSQAKEDPSLFKLISESSIPAAYASGAFRQLSNQKWLPAKVGGKTLTDALVDDLIFKSKKHQIKDLITKQQIMNLYKLCINETEFILPLQYL